MKRVLSAIVVALLVFCGGIALAEETDESDLSISEGVELWLGDIDWSEWERELAGLPDAVRALWNGLGTRETTRQIAETGDIQTALWGGGALWDVLPQLFLQELKSAAGFFALLLSVIMISGVGAALAGDKGAETADVAGLVCRCVLLLVVLTAFTTLARTTVNCITSLGSFMEIATPVLMTLLTAVGGTASAGVFQPAMTLLCTTVTSVVQTVIVPLALCGAVLAVLDKLSERMRVSELAGLIQSASKWTIGALTTIYVAATSIRSMTAAAYDGIAVRAARYAAGSMVPMFGTLVSGTFDTMLGCAALVKNAVGVSAILLVAGTIAMPMLRLLAYQLILRLAAAIAQPLTGAGQAGMLRAGASMIGSLMSACVAVAVMFIMTLGLITGLGNAGYL